LAGKRIKCPKCSSHIQVPGNPLDEDIPADAPSFAPTSRPTGDATEQSWSTPEWDESNEEESPADHQVSSQGKESADTTPDGQRDRLQNVSFGSVADFAMDAGMITYALHWAGVFILICGVSGTILMTGQYLVSIVLEAFGTAVCGLGIVSGLSRLTAQKLEHSATEVSAAWSLFGRRWLDLGLIFVVWLGAVLGAVLVFALLTAVARIPMIGGILGGVMVIPTFAMILITASILINLYLLPIIIGVEDCSIGDAMRYLYHVAVRNGVALYLRYLSALRSIIPFILFTGLVTAGAMAGATFVCGGEQFLLEAEQGGFSPRFVLFTLSIATIVATYVAFVLVYMTVSFVMVYAQSSKRAIVYQ
jgi:hypothetical protein